MQGVLPQSIGADAADKSTSPYIDACRVAAASRPERSTRPTFAQSLVLVDALTGGAASRAAKASTRLDDVTKLGRWHATVYPGCLEATMVTVRAEVTKDPVEGPKHPDASRKAAQARAKTKVRRYCKSNRLWRLVTLTYRDQTGDVDQVAGDVRAFVKALRHKGFRGERFAYCWVRELHQSGMLHVHVALPRYVPKDLLAECWGRGFVDVRSLSKGGGTETAKAWRAASYLSKYVGKTFEDAGVAAGKHRYEVGQGFQPERVSEVVQGEPVVVTGHIAQGFFGGEAPVFCWSSDDADDWTGPPIRVMFWTP